MGKPGQGYGILGENLPRPLLPTRDGKCFHVLRPKTYKNQNLQAILNFATTKFKHPAKLQCATDITHTVVGCCSDVFHEIVYMDYNNRR